MPPKYIQELSQLLDEKLGAKLTPIEDRLAPIEKHLSTLQASVDKLSGDLVTPQQVKAIVEEHTQQLTDQNKQLIDENKQLKEKVLSLECQSRRNNLQFLGIKESAKETWADCEAKVKSVINQLGMDSSKMVIERAHRLGAVGNTSRPIIVKFLSFKDREQVLTQFRTRGREASPQLSTTIIEDYPFEIAVRRRKLLPFLHTARSMKVPCKLSIDKLSIKDKIYTADDIDDIPREYHPPTTRTIDDNIVAFYRQESPFSNFHPSQFSDNGKTFNCVEQFFVFHKAKLFGDDELAEEVLKMDNPGKMKAKGRAVKGYKADQWKTEQLRIMKQGLTLKFDQNSKLKDMLRETKNKTLVEASQHDRFWGAGLSLFSPKLANPSVWPGKNKLGQLLVQVRLELCG